MWSTASRMILANDPQWSLPPWIHILCNLLSFGCELEWMTCFSQTEHGKCNERSTIRLQNNFGFCLTGPHLSSHLSIPMHAVRCPTEPTVPKWGRARAYSPSYTDPDNNHEALEANPSLEEPSDETTLLADTLTANTLEGKEWTRQARYFLSRSTYSTRQKRKRLVLEFKALNLSPITC